MTKFTPWLSKSFSGRQTTALIKYKYKICDREVTSIIRQTNLAQTIDLAADRARYDECAKKLLTYKAVIAWILKSCTKEFSQYSVKFICDNCLKGDIEVSSRAVHQDQPDP